MILILRRTGCGWVLRVCRCGTRLATGLPLRQMTIVSLVASSRASRLEKLVFASCTFTAFMAARLVRLVHSVKLARHRGMEAKTRELAVNDGDDDVPPMM